MLMRITILVFMSLLMSTCFNIGDDKYYSGTGDVIGIVLDTEQTPLSLAGVFLRPIDVPETDTPWYRATSLSDGSFVFQNIPAGYYMLAAFYDDNLGGLEHILVVAEDTITQDLHLADLEPGDALYQFVQEQLEFQVLSISSKDLVWDFSTEGQFFSWISNKNHIKVFDITKRVIAYTVDYASEIAKINIGKQRLAFTNNNNQLHACILSGQSTCRQSDIENVSSFRWMDNVLWFEGEAQEDTVRSLFYWDLENSLGTDWQTINVSGGHDALVSWDVCYDSHVIPIVAQNDDSEYYLYFYYDFIEVDSVPAPKDYNDNPMQYVKTACSPDGAYAISLAKNDQAEYVVQSSFIDPDYSIQGHQRLLRITLEEPAASISGLGWTSNLEQIIVQFSSSHGAMEIRVPYRFMDQALMPDECDDCSSVPDASYDDTAIDADADWYMGSGGVETRQDVDPPDPVLWRSGQPGVLVQSEAQTGMQQLFYSPFGQSNKTQLTFSNTMKLDFAWNVHQQQVLFITHTDDEYQLQSSPIIYE